MVDKEVINVHFRVISADGERTPVYTTVEMLETNPIVNVEFLGWEREKKKGEKEDGV